MLDVTVRRHLQVTIDSRFFFHVAVTQNSVEIFCSEMEWQNHPNLKSTL